MLSGIELPLKMFSLPKAIWQNVLSLAMVLKMSKFGDNLTLREACLGLYSVSKLRCGLQGKSVFPTANLGPSQLCHLLCHPHLPSS